MREKMRTMKVGGSVFGAEFHGLAESVKASKLGGESSEAVLKMKNQVQKLEFRVEQLEFKLKVESSEKKILDQDFRRLTEEHKAFIQRN